MKYAEVAVNSPVGGTGLFSYSISPGMSLQAGQLVWAPFGKRTILGMVFELSETPQVESTRDIISSVSTHPFLNPEQIKLASWLSRHYLCGPFSAGALMLPPGFPTKIAVDIEPTGDRSGVPSLSSGETALLERLDLKGKLKQGDLEKEMGKREAAILLARLESAGLIGRKVHLGPEKVRPKFMKFAALRLSEEEARTRVEELLPKAESQARILKLLIEGKGLLTVPTLRSLFKGYGPPLKELAGKGWIAVEEKEVWRDPLSTIVVAPNPKPVLTPAQREACERIATALERNSRDVLPTAPDVFLLHGVTGSGKTEVYLESLEKALALGKKALVLVPEIALTTQTIERFLARFPGRVAVIHSRLSMGERFDEWRRIKNGEFGVVIGSRSAIFAPQPDLGLIVIDEEHEWSYKNQEMPRYHARDVALELARIRRAAVVLGSATPDVESYYNAVSGRYTLLRLPGRITPAGEAPLPEVQLVDMREEHKAGNHGFFSRTLLKGLEDVLQRREQAILFLNRRGSSTLVLCKACGYVLRCRRCFVALTYHAQGDFLLCHQCNLRLPMMQQCPKCGKLNMRFRGMGTEGLEKETREAFPGVRTLRWDSDTVLAKGSHEEILSLFRSHEADILIGTQMIAKGLDLPLVTLVGIVMADLGLQLPHYRAGERVFQLLCQAAGRAGRGVKPGKVVIQTYNPQHYAIYMASRQDYESFYERELAFRRQYGYPPFLRMAGLTFTYSNQEKCIQETHRLKKEIEADIEKKGLKNIVVAGPSPSFPEKVRGRYYWNLMIKGEDPASLVSGMRFGRGWSVDIDPATVL